MTEERLLQIYRENDLYLKGVAFNYLKDEYDKDDAVSHIWVNVLIGKINLDDTDNIRIRLATCTANYCMDLLRHRKMAKNSHREIFLLSLVEYELDYTKWDIKVIMDAAEKLSEDRKKIFKLKYVEGLKNIEIAESLNISPNTVGVQIKRSLCDIKRYLEMGTMKLEGYHFNQSTLDKLIRCIKSGMNYKEIMARFQITATTYYKYKKLAFAK